MSKTRSESAVNQSKDIPGVWEDALDLWDENGMLLAKVLKRGDAKSRHAMLNAAPDMLLALKAQHDAIDLLFAMLISADTKRFLPSKSGQPWEAMIKGNEAIAKAEGK